MHPARDVVFVLIFVLLHDDLQVGTAQPALDTNYTFLSFTLGYAKGITFAQGVEQLFIARVLPVCNQEYMQPLGVLLEPVEKLHLVMLPKHVKLIHHQKLPLRCIAHLSLKDVEQGHVHEAVVAPIDV
jgi:hypothetical protein